MLSTYNKCHLGTDGFTAYERLKGKKYTGLLLPFAEPVLHRVTGAVTGGVMRERWLDGIFMGRSSRTDEAIVLNSDGEVVRSRSVTPQHDGIRITNQMLDNINAEPGEHLRKIHQSSGEPRVPENEQTLQEGRGQTIT